MSMKIDRINLFTDAAGDVRWNMQAPNGRIIATSGEGYKNFGDMMDMVKRVTGYSIEDGASFGYRVSANSASTRVQIVDRRQR